MTEAVKGRDQPGLEVADGRMELSPSALTVGARRTRWARAMAWLHATATALALLVAFATPVVSDGPGPAASSQLEPSAVVGPEVAAALREREWVRVLVALSPPTGGKRAGGAEFAAPHMWEAISTRCASVLERLPPGEFELTHRFRSVPAFAGLSRASGILALARDPRVVRVDLDRGGDGALAEVVPLVGLDELGAMGFTGLGVTVAVLDTGADLSHPDLQDSLVGQRCFCTLCCPNGESSQEGEGIAWDDNNHGSHTTGIITSNGGVSPPGGAPDASILAVKV
ncbi:MAG: S8 family serine peptidase, partial [Myxococcota bacterium]